MPARRKTLEELVGDRSFLSRRHAERLLEAPPLRQPHLRRLQESYAAESDESVRAAIAIAFERAVQSAESPKLSFGAVMYSIAGPDPANATALGLRRVDGPIDRPAFDKLQRRWKWWAARYGALWREKHGVAGHSDDVRLYRRLSGDRQNKRADVAREWLDAHREQVDALIASREPIPDPPLPTNIRDVLMAM